MTRRFGEPGTFAVDVGEAVSPQLRVVDLWAAGKLLTTDDNVAFLPSFGRAMRASAAQVRRRDVAPYPLPEDVFRLLNGTGLLSGSGSGFCGGARPSTTYAYLDGELVLAFAFWRAAHPVPGDRGLVFVARVAPDAFVSTVEAAVEALEGERRIEPT